MEMVRFLIEGLGCDVNGIDIPEDKRWPAHHGTQLNHAAHSGSGVEVVKYILEVSLVMRSGWLSTPGNECVNLGSCHY